MLQQCYVQKVQCLKRLFLRGSVRAEEPKRVVPVTLGALNPSSVTLGALNPSSVTLGALNPFRVKLTSSLPSSYPSHYTLLLVLSPSF